MTRVRKQGGNDAGKVDRVDYFPNGSVQGTYIHLTDGVTAYASSNERTITDTVTPQFVKRRAKGEVFMNDVIITKRDASSVSTPKVIGPFANWGKRTINGDFIAFYAVNPADDPVYVQRLTAAKSYVLQRAFDKVASEDMMAMVTVVEAGKTARMLTSPFDKTLKALRRVVNAKVKLLERGMRLRDALLMAWLEERVGWKPLLFDIQNIMEAYSQNLASFTKPTRLVARASFKTSYEKLEDAYTASAPFLGSVPMVRDKSVAHKVSAGVLYELYDENLAAAGRRNLGLRLEDVPRSIWEATPLSFVIDRYVTIGAWLNALVPKPGVRVLGQWVTTVGSAKLRYRMLDYSLSVAGNPVFLPGGDWLEDNSVSVIRETAGTNQYLAVPAWNPKDHSWQQVLDEYALIILTLRGLVPPKR